MKLFDVYPLYDVSPVRAKDVYVYGVDGKKYLDLYGGHAVISIGHRHRRYNRALKQQINRIGFYSNAVQNPLQQQLADAIGEQSCLDDYELFLCSSGAEANENALKLASFHTGKKRIIAFKNGFHGRTSACVAATDNPKIVAPLNAQQEVSFLPLNDLEAVRKELAKGDVCGVIVEAIQGVGGLDQAETTFLEGLEQACDEFGSCLIADEVQSGFARTGTFFGFQTTKIRPHIISMAKGMGNGFPVGGILIRPDIEAQYGLLGTTFGGNHLACRAALSVCEVLRKEGLQKNAQKMGEYFITQAQGIPQLKQIKGRGLMLGMEFDFPVADLRKRLVYEAQIFTGGSSNKNLIRILPSLTVQPKHLDRLISTLKQWL